MNPVSILGLFLFAALVLPMDKALAQLEPDGLSRAAPALSSAKRIGTEVTSNEGQSVTLKVFALTPRVGLPNFRRACSVWSNNLQTDYLKFISESMISEGTELPASSVWLDQQGLLIIRGTPPELEGVENFFEFLNGHYQHKNLPLVRSQADASSLSSETTGLSLRTFTVNASNFTGTVLKAMDDHDPVSSPEPGPLLKTLFGRLGVDLDPPKVLTIGSQNEMVKVKATQVDLDDLEKIMSAMNQPSAPTDSRTLIDHRDEIDQKLRRIRLETVDFNSVPLTEALRRLSAQAAACDPEKTGVKLMVDPRSSKNEAQLAQDIGAIPIQLNLADVSLADVLDAFELVAHHPIEYSVENSGVVFRAKKDANIPSDFAVFKIDAATLSRMLKLWDDMLGPELLGQRAGNSGKASTPAGPDEPEALNLHSQAAKEFHAGLRRMFQVLGINLKPPQAMSYNDRMGLLYVKASRRDLATISRSLEALQQDVAATQQHHL
jgi:hypothetical protein